MKLKVVLETGENGMWIASVPALRGCRTQGTNHDEALTNIQEAINAWIETEQDK